MATDGSAPPLRDVGVVVTRDEEDGRLRAVLAAFGARVHHWPTIAAAPPDDPAPLRTALERPGTYDWLVLTSRRAVEAVVEFGRGGGGGAAAVAARVAVVGTSTAEAAEAAGLEVDLVPDRATGEALVEALGRAGVGPGTRVLFPASSIARETVPEGLRALGAHVDRVTAYRIVPAALDRSACRRALEAGEVRVVTLTSASSVRNLRSALGEALFSEVARTAVFAAIGPVTGAAAREAGAERVIEASEYTFEGLAQRVAEWRTNEVNGGAR